MVSDSMKITTLDNGLRVVTNHLPKTGLVQFDILNAVGARHEQKNENGLVHGFEHLVFNGTKKRSKKTIIHQVENGGGSLDADTDYEEVAFRLLTIAESATEHFDILSDMVENPAFPKQEFETEKKAIIEEIRNYDDDDDDVASCKTYELVFGDHALGRPILGTVASVRRMNQTAVRNFIDNKFSYGQMIVCVSGDIEHDAAIDAVEKNFHRNLKKEPSVALPAMYHGGSALIQKPNAQVTTHLSFQGVALSDPDFYAVEALSIIMGIGMASRLHEEIREDRGLAYTIHAGSNNFCDTGIFEICFQSNPENAQKKILPLVCDEILKTSQGFSDLEIQRAKNRLLLSARVAKNDVTGMAARAGADLLSMGRVITFEETEAEINALDAETVNKAASRIFASTPTYVAVGPVKKMPSYNHLRDWLRP